MATRHETVNVLLVDDRPEGLLALEAALGSSEYNLVKASSGKEALACLLNDDFAVILLDVQMPEMDGFETATIIKSRDRTKGIPILFITAIDKDSTYIYKGYETGAVDYLLKPFDPAILRSKVAVFADIFRKNEEIKRQAELLRQNERIQREQALSRLELESLQRYRDLADAIPHIVWRAYPDGTLDYFNRVWSEFTGLTLEQSTGAGWQAAFHPMDKDRLMALWHKAMESQSKFEVECRVRRTQDGSYRWHLIRVVPEMGKTGRITAWLGTGTDIDDRRQVEDDMRRAREAALEASRLKSEFLANISHEIRTPINGIIGMTDLLLDTSLNEEQFQFAKTVIDSSHTLLAIVNDVLDFSKVEAGKIDIEKVDFALRSAIEGPADLMKAKAGEKRLSLMTHISPDIPYALSGDPGRLGQIVLNLIGNAIKFTANGSVVVRVTLESPPDSEPVVLKFSVTDTGIGLSNEAKQRLFRPFTQADGSTVRKYGGTGLGLSISKNLVELMGGTIGVDSTEGKGSTFWFTLPFERAKQAPHEVDKGVENVKGARVLVVDDDVHTSDIIQSYARAWGMPTESARNGEEALSLLRREVAAGRPFDIACVDQDMPNMNGFALAAAIRADASLSRTRLVLVTAHYDKGIESRALAAGFSAYLSKPFRQSQLFNCIMRAMKQAEPSRPREISLSAAPGQGRILVAEDNNVNQMVTLKQLAKLGYSAHAVSNGKEAIAALAQANYDLVLMDCQMPEMDGFDATRAIRDTETGNGRHIPIIALTAHVMEGDAEKCTAAGMDDYLSKPIDRQTLGELIGKWLKS